MTPVQSIRANVSNGGLDVSEHAIRLLKDAVSLLMDYSVFIRKRLPDGSLSLYLTQIDMNFDNFLYNYLQLLQ